MLMLANVLIAVALAAGGTVAEMLRRVALVGNTAFGADMQRLCLRHRPLGHKSLAPIGGLEAEKKGLSEKKQIGRAHV